jgi:hypothetical protein
MFSRKVTVLLGAVLVALPLTVAGQPTKGGGTTTVPVGAGQGPVTGDTLIPRYTPLAGSSENAASLVNGLRNGTKVTLNWPTGSTPATQAPTAQQQTSFFGDMPPPPPPDTPPPPPPGDVPPPPPPLPVEFTPPSGTGWGNVDIALAFTQAQFAELLITQPNPEQIAAVLMGGKLVNGNQVKELTGILQMRAKGMGWGQIAAQFGYKLQ